MVLVAELPGSYSGQPFYEVRSAGEVDPPGRKLERLRPRAGATTTLWTFTGSVAPAQGELEEVIAKLREGLEGINETVEPRVWHMNENEEPRFWSLPVVVATVGEPPSGSARAAESTHEDVKGRWIGVQYKVNEATRKKARERASTLLLGVLPSVVEVATTAVAGFEVSAAD